MKNFSGEHPTSNIQHPTSNGSKRPWMSGQVRQDKPQKHWLLPAFLQGLGIYGGFLFLLLSPCSVWAGDWEYYGTNGEYFCFYNPSRIVRPDPETVQVWLKWLATKEGKKKRTQEMDQRKIPKAVYEKYEATQVLMEINCREKKYLVLSLADFDDKEKIILSGLKTCFPRELAQSFPIEADTSEEDLRVLLCPAKK
jgi:hypothetical protein